MGRAVILEIRDLPNDVDVERVRTKLDAYSPTLRQRAITALLEVRRRVQESIVFSAPHVAWSNRTREDIFNIYYLACADGVLSIVDINTDCDPEEDCEGGFVVLVGKETLLIDSRSAKDGPSCELLGLQRASYWPIVDLSRRLKRRSNDTYSSCLSLCHLDQNILPGNAGSFDDFSIIVPIAIQKRCGLTNWPGCVEPICSHCLGAVGDVLVFLEMDQIVNDQSRIE